MKKYLIFFCLFALPAFAQTHILTILNATNCFYSRPDNSLIDCTLDTVEAGTIPYTAAANDSMPYGQQLWADLQAGKYGTPAAYTPPPPPPPAQQAAQALANGLTITSIGTSALNGTYSVDSTAQANISAVTTYVLINGTFPGGVSTMPWYDMGGSAHTMPSVTEFKAFATAIANYVAAVMLYGSSGSGSLPSNTATIP